MTTIVRLMVCLALLGPLSGCVGDPAAQTVGARAKVTALLAVGETPAEVIANLGPPFQSNQPAAYAEVLVYGWGGLIERFEGSLAAFRYGRSLYTNRRQSIPNPPPLTLRFTNGHLEKIEGL